jgi:outer membrane protein OmpA-like peptidoglycan-associated protein
VKCWLILATVAFAASPAGAQDRLLPSKRRITDESLARDRHLIRSWQERAAALPEVPETAYPRARARALLAFVGEEYDLANRSTVVDSAFAEAVTSLDALGSGAMVPAAVPEPRAAATLAPGLWAQLAAVQVDDAAGCAAVPVAAAQVKLLEAGELASAAGAPAARPALLEAARLASSARDTAAACSADGAPEAPRSQAATEPRTEVVHVVPGEVHFAFDRAELADVSLPIIDRVARVLDSVPGLGLRLEAHADEQGPERHNLTLSARRGAAVAEALIARGIAATRITVEARGAHEPLRQGKGAMRHALDRRVTLVWVGEPGSGERVRSERQREDVQVTEPRRRHRSRAAP